MAVIIFSWMSGGFKPAEAKNAATKLYNADKGLPNPQGYGPDKYVERLNTLQELTGSSPSEIADVTIVITKRMQAAGIEYETCFRFM